MKWYKSLASRKGRQAAGAFLAEGERAVSQIARCRPGAIKEIVSVNEPPTAYARYPQRRLNQSQFTAVAPSQTPQGFMAVIDAPTEIDSATLPETPGRRVLLLENIQDPGNVGTLLRTAAAFNYAGAILSDKCADPLAPKCVQGSAGTLLSLWLRRTPDYLKMAAALQARGYTVIATDLSGQAVPQELHGKDNLLLALGNEAAGLSATIIQMADYRMRLPINDERAESLNVAACGAICMYLTGLPDNTSISG